MSRPSYRAAIEWIALNDNPAAAEPEEALRGYLTVALVADLFAVSIERVAKDVAAARQNLEKQTPSP